MPWMLRYIHLLIGILIAVPALSQNMLDTHFYLQKRYTSPVELLDSIQSKTSVNISYPSTLFATSSKINIKKGKYNISSCLDRLCIQSKCIYSIIENTIVIKDNSKKVNTKQNQLYGKVIEDSTGEAIAYAYLFIDNGRQSYRANRFGYFSIPKPPRKEFTIWCLSPNKSSTSISVKYYTDSFITIVLPQLKSIKKVTIKGSFKRDSSSIEDAGSDIILTHHDLKSTPPFLGEYDAMNALTYRSGVIKGTEGNNGLFIRGGSPDQNLITMDGAILYNPNHFFGLFSPFNADAIQNVTLQKSNFSAETGGRISSHLAIDLKEGNTIKNNAHFSISPLAISASANGPIFRNKTTYLLTFRRSYFDLLVTPLLPETNSLGFYFYDINGKVTHRFNDRHTLSFGYFNFRDKAFNRTRFRTPEFDGMVRTEESEQGLDWGNTMMQVKYKGQISKRKFLESIVYYTRFGYNNSVQFRLLEDSLGTKLVDDLNRYNFESTIETFASNHHLTYWVNRTLDLKVGIGYFYHSFLPSNSSLTLSTGGSGGLNRSSFDNDPIFANETYGFVSLEYHPHKRVNVSTGFRLSSFHTPRVNYFNPQPRLSLKYQLRNQWNLFSSATQTAQYLHFATNNTIGIPLDLWLPATDELAPATSNQFALGISKRKQSWQFSAESYYKTLSQIIDYVEGEEYLGLSNSWEEKFVQGSGESYGIDLNFEKNWNNSSIQGGYSWSKNTRQFDSINQGEVYPFKYDRRHNFSLIYNRQLSEKWVLFATFIYGSGSAVTLPIARYPSAGSISGGDILIYGERNAHRLRDYHRLDLSLSHTKQKKHFHRIWNISIYNALNRQNPFYITPGLDDEGNRNFVQVSLLPFIPSVTYRIEFN